MEKSREMKIRFVRLDATVSPAHLVEIKKEIKAAADQGRKLTTSEIIRQELDGRYFSGKGE